MNCLQVMKKLTDYLQGQLPGTEAHQLHAHVSRCEDCRFVLDSALRTIDLYFTVDADAKQQPASTRAA